MTLTHDAARALNVAAARGRLAAADAAALQEHLAGCEACRVHAESERRLSEVLETKLPQYAAPLALKRRLAMQWAPAALSAARPRRAGRWAAGLVALAASVAAVVGVSTLLLVERRDARTRLEGETVNDHLRMLGGAPLAQVTGGLHEVKPWFGGKLDFAPNVRFAGDDEFPLSGGAVEPFLDRRAAVFVYRRRLHTASLFVVPADGLAFPTGVGSSTVRGFNVVLWRTNDQGYALVSDLGLSELLLLEQRIASSR
jgi:anti-sigma factor RsiW